MAKQLQHRVTRGITKAWEHGNRELTYFDFETERFQTQGSKRLFADKGLWPRCTEARFDELVETPLLQARDRVRVADWSDRAALAETDAQLMLAMHLSILMQTTRIVTPSHAAREEFWGLPPAQLEALTAHLHSNRSFAWAKVPGGTKLLCPEVGFFPLPLTDKKLQVGVAFAMPLDAEIALVSMLKTTDMAQLAQQVRGPYLVNFSVSPNARRIVVHKGVLDGMGEDRLRSELQQLRNRTAEVIADVGKVMGIYNKMDEMIGLPVYGPYLK